MLAAYLESVVVVPGGEDRGILVVPGPEFPDDGAAVVVGVAGELDEGCGPEAGPSKCWADDDVVELNRGVSLLRDVDDNRPANGINPQ